VNVMLVAKSTGGDWAELITFVILAAVSVGSAIGMVMNRSAVYSALLLVINFFCLAGFYVLLQAQFIAAVQVVVYAGAIMVLFLFVLMMIGVEHEEALKETIRGQRTTAAVLGILLLAGVGTAVGTKAFSFAKGSARLAQVNAGGNVQAVGRLLFTHYAFAFEATGVLLVVAAVGALVLGRRRHP